MMLDKAATVVCGFRPHRYLRIPLILGMLVIGRFFPSHALGVGGSERWILASNGRPAATVIVSEGASEVELHAAAELCLYLHKITGAQFAPATVPADGSYGIHLATVEHFPAFSAETVGLGEHGFLIHADAKGMFITGLAPAGVLYGTYAFLEDHLGVRWFFPGEEGEYHPRVSNLSIGYIHDLQKPSFEWREVAFSRTGGAGVTMDTWDWIARNRLQPIFDAAQGPEYRKRAAVVKGGGHVFSRMVPDGLFDEHPEYFALVEGERRRQRGEGRCGQPCTTHPQVIEMAGRYTSEWFDDNPTGIFTISANDCRGFCECDRCMALEPPGGERGRGGEASTRYFTFIDAIAQQVYRDHPKARLRTLAYMGYRLLPAETVNIDPRMWVILCDHSRCFRHALDDPGCDWNENGRYAPKGGFIKMYKDWAKLPNPRGNFPYYNMIAHYGGGIPTNGVVSIPLEGVSAADMRFMHRLGHRGWSIRVRPPEASYSRRYDTRNTRGEWRANFHWMYLQAKLAWKIDLDESATLEDLNTKFYGPAAVPMVRFRLALRKIWEARGGHFLYHSRFEEFGRLLADSGAVDELTTYLEEAERAAFEQPIFRKRVAEEREIFKNSWLTAYDLSIRERKPTAQPKTPDPEDIDP